MDTHITEKAALDYHRYPYPGKTEVVPTKPYSTQYDLSLAYSPGVAYPCLKIADNPSDVFKYTNKSNLVAVISNGTAVLGLGNIGALASKPVMEGKALLFKIYSGIDSFDIEINETDPDKFVEIVKALAPTFGGINLEDIKSPECFAIEKRLKEETDIPVMHDDQHGTAIITTAALINALIVQGKEIDKAKVVISGAGAAAIMCARMYVRAGVNKDNIIMCDSHGPITKLREHLSAEKGEFATNAKVESLEEALIGADVFLGLSVGNVVSKDMVKSMAERPIIFALANPDPEITFDDAKEARPDAIVATGRSDYPNQVNNVLGFPYIFRGALDCGATDITEGMKMAAAKAIAALARERVPGSVLRAYQAKKMSFGPDYILPKPFDPRLLCTVAPAVAQQAMKEGIARRPFTDEEAYERFLHHLMDHNRHFVCKCSASSSEI